MAPDLIAGMISTSMFAAGNIPMLLKAARTRSLASYSRLQLMLNSTANVIHWFYILELPFGPIWILHSFYTVSMALMLIWHLHFEGGSMELPRGRVRGWLARSSLWRHAGPTHLTKVLTTRPALLFVTVLTLTGCPRVPFGGPRFEVTSWDVEAEYDEVWAAALWALQQLEIPVDEATKGGGRIVSGRFRPSGSADWAICTPRHWGQLELQVAGSVTGTRLTASVAFRSGSPLDEFAARPCPSTGNLERAISRLVIEATREPAEKPEDVPNPDTAGIALNLQRAARRALVPQREEETSACYRVH